MDVRIGVGVVLWQSAERAMRLRYIAMGGGSKVGWISRSWRQRMIRMTPGQCLVHHQRPSCQPKGTSQGLDPTRIRGVQFLEVAIQIFLPRRGWSKQFLDLVGGWARWVGG
jgi:hypothetical protein